MCFIYSPTVKNGTPNYFQSIQIHPNSPQIHLSPSKPIQINIYNNTYNNNHNLKMFCLTFIQSLLQQFYFLLQYFHFCFKTFIYHHHNHPPHFPSITLSDFFYLYYIKFLNKNYLTTHLLF